MSLRKGIGFCQQSDTALMAVFYFLSCCIMNVKKYAYQGEIII